MPWVEWIDECYVNATVQVSKKDEFEVKIGWNERQVCSHRSTELVSVTRLTFSRDSALERPLLRLPFEIVSGFSRHCPSSTVDERALPVCPFEADGQTFIGYDCFGRTSMRKVERKTRARPEQGRGRRLRTNEWRTKRRKVRCRRSASVQEQASTGRKDGQTLVRFGFDSIKECLLISVRPSNQSRAKIEFFLIKNFSILFLLLF